MSTDIPESWTSPTLDHDRREVMIPMRDGVHLKTVIIVPRQATDADQAPIILTRTPYGAVKSSQQTPSPRAEMALRGNFAELFAAGYIIAIQDIRGKYDSEGDYFLNRPVVGELNDSGTDHTTDTWDTIDWLVHNVPEASGNVGTTGLSYDGFTTLMSLVDPHPALKASVPVNPMVDGWMGDDWFHNGAFRATVSAEYLYKQATSTDSKHDWPSDRYDVYDTWMVGSVAEVGKQYGLDRLPPWQRLMDHPDYDRFWSAQAVDSVLGARDVPTLHVHSQWDAEDIDGSVSVYAAMPGSQLAIGPWSHGSVCHARGDSLGPVRFGSDTARWFRRHVMVPFFDRHLRGGDADIAPVTAFETGLNEWRRYEQWPPATARTTPLYLGDGFTLSNDSPTESSGSDAYVSDPAKPVTYQPRPIRPQREAHDAWAAWLVGDQRFASDRTDVLTYAGPVLTEPLRLAGQPVAHLYAATTGTDADWVVKLIDVYPDEVPGDADMGAYQLAVAMQILRGRHREPQRASAVPADEVVHYRIRLPHISHAFLPGHRLMVQIQSSWFPLYDRNPQIFVPNVMTAEPGDYVKQTHTVHRSASTATRIDLPVLPG